MSKFRFLDFFSGIGGFRLGLESAGGECLGFAEIDPYARKSYKAIHDTKGEEEWHDITKVTDDDFRHFAGKVDLIAGGFPCQAFSIAGKRMGFNESRGTLFFHIARAAKEIKPRYLLLENVKGLVSHDKGRTIAVILNTLKELGYGHIEWGILNSKYWNVPQNRDRIFIVAELKDEPQAPYLLDLLAKQEENGVTKALKDILEQQVPESFYLTEERTKKLITKLEDHIQIRQATIKGYDEAYIGDTVNLAQPSSKTRRGRVGKQIANTLVTGLEQAVIVPNTQIFGDLNHYNNFQMNRVYGIEGQSPSLNTVSGGGREPKVAIPPLYRIRRLTPLECWRLQGFTDEQFHAAKAAGNSNTQLYKQAGNSVTVNVIEAIAAKLFR